MFYREQVSAERLVEHYENLDYLSLNLFVPLDLFGPFPECTFPITQ